MTPGNDFLDGLVCGYAPRLRRVHPIVVLHGYADDSGSSPERKVFVLAGYVSTADKWKVFSAKWDRLCKKEPRTPDFKAAKAWRLKGDPAKGEYTWTEEQRDKRFTELSGLIARQADYRVDAMVRWSDYERLIRGRSIPELDNPYYFLFYHVIYSFAEFMDEANIDGTVDWVFDEQGPLGEDVRGWYYKIRDLAPPNIQRRLGGPPQFKHDTEVLPLKAADMLAWHLHRYLDRERVHPFVPESDNKNLSILRSMPGITNRITAEDLMQHLNLDGRGPQLQAHAGFYLPANGTLKRISAWFAGAWCRLRLWGRP